MDMTNQTMETGQPILSVLPLGKNMVWAFLVGGAYLYRGAGAVRTSIRTGGWIRMQPAAPSPSP